MCCSPACWTRGFTASSAFGSTQPEYLAQLTLHMHSLLDARIGQLGQGALREVGAFRGREGASVDDDRIAVVHDQVRFLVRLDGIGTFDVEESPAPCLEAPVDLLDRHGPGERRWLEDLDPYLRATCRYGGDR